MIYNKRIKSKEEFIINGNFKSRKFDEGIW